MDGFLDFIMYWLFASLAVGLCMFFIWFVWWLWLVIKQQWQRTKRPKYFYLYGGQFSPVTVEIETDKPIVNGHIRIFWYGEKLVDLPCESIKSVDHEE